MKDLVKLGRSGLMVCLLVLCFGFVQGATDSGHDASDIFVAVNGVSSSLQGAIDSGKFGVDYSGGSAYSGSFDFGHADEVFVNVNGSDKSLQDAIIDGSLCSSSAVISGSYSGDVDLGHKGEDVMVDFGGVKSLQTAINEGKFGGKAWMPLASTVCDDITFNQTMCGREKLNVSGTKVCCISHASSACYANDVYWYDSCGMREDKRIDCGALGCSGGVCNTCSSHASSTCYSDDVYWYDSCGVREDKKTECGALGCSGSTCNTCISHASSTCYSNDVYWYDSCGVREDKRIECGALGCSGSTCNTCSSHASSTCYSNDVYWYDSCGVREDKKTECGAVGCTGSTCCVPSCGDNACGDDGCGGSCGTCIGTSMCNLDTERCCVYIGPFVGASEDYAWDIPGSWWCPDESVFDLNG